MSACNDSDTYCNIAFMTNYLRFRQLATQYVPVARVTLWSWIKAGIFPAPIKLNPGSQHSPLAWPEDEILQWLANRPRGLNGRRVAASNARRRKAIERRLGRPVILGPTKSGVCRMAPLPRPAGQWSADWSGKRGDQ
jgi:predicted DNA-binding transcriptional regulator AlpA